MSSMKNIITTISVVTAIAFLLISVISTVQIFLLVVGGNAAVRGELWVLLITTFTGGIIMLGIAWGIAELTESRRAQREIMLSTSHSHHADDE